MYTFLIWTQKFRENAGKSKIQSSCEPNRNVWKKVVEELELKNGELLL